VTPERELRRLRAALGASADALLTRGASPDRLLQEEVTFLAALYEALGQRDGLAQLWRDLRNRSLAVAAGLEPTEHALALLRARLEADERL